jgi:hypothetical protein
MKHKEGDSNCPDCRRGYPEKCECGGLIHAIQATVIHGRDIGQKATIIFCDRDCET